jgi:rubrerythrin
MSKTDDNLKAAFAGESQARNKYAFFAEAARKEGYRYIAKIFEETAANEMSHARDEFILSGGLGDTAANLEAAMNGENYEAVEMYPQFAADADAEGNKAAASLFRMIAKVEMHHRDRYQRLLEMVKNDTVFKREKPIMWKCDTCGYIHEGKTPPPQCPCCKQPREFFEPTNMDV